MANEVTISLNSLSLSSTNNIAIEDINVAISKAIKQADLPKAHGSIIPIGFRKDIIFKIKGTVIASDYDALRTNLDTIKSTIESSSEYSFILDDDRFMKVQYRSFSYAWKKIRTFATFTFDLIASDPLWWGNTLNSSTPAWTTGVSFNVTNNGNAPTRAKITITAGGVAVSDDIKVQNSTTGDIFKYRGAISSAQALIVNNKVDATDLAVTNNGSDDIVNFEGDFITLNPGVNAIVFTSAIAGSTFKIEWRDAWY